MCKNASAIKQWQKSTEVAEYFLLNLNMVAFHGIKNSPALYCERINFVVKQIV